MDELVQFCHEFVQNGGGEVRYRDLYDAVNASQHNQQSLYNAKVLAEQRGLFYSQVRRVEDEMRPVEFVIAGPRPQEE